MSEAKPRKKVVLAGPGRGEPTALADALAALARWEVERREREDALYERLARKWEEMHDSMWDRLADGYRVGPPMDVVVGAVATDVLAEILGARRR